MKQFNWKFNLVLALCLAFGTAANAQNNAPNNNEALLQKAHALAASNPAGALAVYELAMEQSVGKDSKSFGKAAGGYWDMIHSQNNYPRAYDFFSQLAASHPSSADVLGSEGSAIGGYLGWLSSNGMEALVERQFLSTLNDKAHDAFEKSLKIDPENFAGLFGYAIYESYNPEGRAHSKELFAKLETLRPTHPYYPWDYVEQMKKQRLGN